MLFTIDPLTGDPSQITIEATFGLGVPIVGGEITPDRYGVDKVTFELARAVDRAQGLRGPLRSRHGRDTAHGARRRGRRPRRA